MAGVGSVVGRVLRNASVLALVTLSLGVAVAGTALGAPPDAPPRTSPAPDARLDTPPPDVTIALPQRPPADAETVVMVTDAAGVRRDVGTPRLSDSVVTVDLAPGLDAGTYTVDWWVRPPRYATGASAGTRGTTAVGELSGTFLFTLVERPTASTPAVLALAGPQWTGPCWIAGVLLLAVGTAAVAARRQARRAAPVRRTEC